MPRIVTIINAYANKKNKYQMNQKLKNTSYDLPNGFSGVDLHAYIVSIYGHLLYAAVIQNTNVLYNTGI